MGYQSEIDRLDEILNDTWSWLKDGFRNSQPSRPTSPSPPRMPEERPQRPVEISGSKDSVRQEVKQIPQPDSDSTKSLEEIADTVRNCRMCNLALIRESTVPGTGSTQARLMVITQPPWEYASFETSPLVEVEQDYLEKWIRAVGLDPHKDVFITPAVKCPTPALRPALSEEISSCSNYLMQQVKALSPSAILALGSSACAALTGQHSDFPNLVAREWEWNKVPTLILWRPAEVLQNPEKLRRPVWESLKNLRRAWDALPGN